MSDVFTTSKSFPVVDITHKPKRTQADNLRKSINSVSSVPQEITTEIKPHYEVPTMITLEKAIHFYEENATGDLEKLYSQTAKWLRSLLTNKPIE